VGIDRYFVEINDSRYVLISKHRIIKNKYARVRLNKPITVRHA